VQPMDPRGHPQTGPAVGLEANGRAHDNGTQIGYVCASRRRDTTVP
jgi:hypothetical protein